MLTKTKMLHSASNQGKIGSFKIRLNILNLLKVFPVIILALTLTCTRHIKKTNMTINLWYRIL